MINSLSLLLSLGLIWGSGYSIARYAMTHGVPPLGYSFWQAWGPALLLLLIISLKKISLPLNARHLVYYFFTGLLGIAIPNTIMYFSAAHLPAGILTIVVNTVPMFIYPLALLAHQEKYDRIRVAGVFIGVLGVMAIIVPNAALPEINFKYWILLTLITPLSFSLCSIYITRYRPEKTDSVTLSTGMLLAAAFLITPIVLANHSLYSLGLPFNLAKAVVFLEILLSSAGYILFFKLLKNAGPVYYSLTGGVVTITGLIWGHIVFNEHYDHWIIFAIVAILIAILMLSIRFKAYIKK
jgi:drug/metabolite transporter (DMT)-like permease